VYKGPSAEKFASKWFCGFREYYWEKLSYGPIIYTRL
jgi:hypothetical protein